MNAKKDSTAIIGVGAAACAVCCAGPILGILAAIGLGTAAGFAAFGVVALAIGGTIAALMLIRRRRRVAACSTTPTLDTPIELTARLQR